jgi:cytochrome c
MDSFEINKIVAAVLLVALLVIGIGKLSNVIFYVEKPEKPGYAVEVQQASSTTAATAVVEEEKVDIAALMALGDVASGENIFKKMCSMSLD